MGTGLWGFDFGWSAPDEGIRAPGWGDPLGLRRDVTDIATALVPVFRKRHTTPDQFGLMCYALRSSAESVDDFLAIERMWALACARAGRRWPGERRARQQLQAGVDHNLEIALISNQLASGLWGTNRRAAGVLGLTEPSVEGPRTSPTEYRLSRVGDELATVFRASFVASPRKVAAAVRRRSCTSSALDSFVTSSDGGTDALAQILTRQLRLRSGDREMGDALARVFEVEGGLTVTTLVRNRSLLTPRQVTAALRARALVRVINLVERPFRLWFAAESDDPLDPGLWRHPAWAATEWSPSVRRVYDQGQSRPGWGGLEELARTLARHRDEALPQRGGFRIDWAQTPREDFRLNAFASLLGAGLMAK